MLSTAQWMDTSSSASPVRAPTTQQQECSNNGGIRLVYFAYLATFELFKYDL